MLFFQKYAVVDELNRPRSTPTSGFLAFDCTPLIVLWEQGDWEFKKQQLAPCVTGRESVNLERFDELTGDLSNQLEVLVEVQHGEFGEFCCGSD